MNVTSDIEMASLEADHIRSMVRAVSDGIYTGSGDYRNYEGAFEEVYDMSDRLVKHLDTVAERMIHMERVIKEFL